MQGLIALEPRRAGEPQNWLVGDALGSGASLDLPYGVTIGPLPKSAELCHALVTCRMWLDLPPGQHGAVT